MSKQVDWAFGTISCECDKCGKTEEIEFDGSPNFRACQHELKNLGWVSTEIDCEWKDFSSKKCEEKFKKDLEGIKNDK